LAQAPARQEEVGGRAEEGGIDLVSGQRCPVRDEGQARFAPLRFVNGALRAGDPEIRRAVDAFSARLRGLLGA